MSEPNRNATQFIESLPAVYEAMVDWPKRLAREAPFFRRLIDQIQAKRLVDVACGTGQHVAMFRSWGLDVEGSDASPEMITRARQINRSEPGLRLVVRNYEDPIETDQPFDVAICTGNSLSLAADLDVATRAIQRMFEAVRSGGTVVVQVLNIWRLAEGPCLWQKCFRMELNGQDVVVVKGIVRCGQQAHIQLLVIRLTDETQLEADSSLLLGFRPSQFEQIARQAGAGEVVFCGGYENQPFDPATSADLIMVAHKA